MFHEDVSKYLSQHRFPASSFASAEFVCRIPREFPLQ